ncbi:cyclic nucleotide-binding domain-containing protein [Microcystis aeruginosa CS-563/04]|jgi:CRP-like cAMP-binding protein|uniref:cyclic nucleotide-binding domain-containing protein n=1 Tax=Microcystis aeruginosa TaxID=1126 RepID=UPI00232CE2BB|nr:cyclic nucleotide-binding domain-containing protein [Microcystis aeruginosa]MDB9421060.1 cyclic nucleotide-binding domain-containing protein [Microcystis aeruginosa CS-563/04]NCR10787.1 cyclic nucleotide-binding domain-containing protein [Microcystis aeruginosa LG13-11]
MLSPVDTIKILENHPDRTFPAGEVIFADGTEGELMYGILSGEVEMYIRGHLIETLEKGDVFGAGALLHEDKLRESTAIAKTDCKLAYLNQPQFLFAVQETPMFAIEVLRSYSDRFRRLKKIFTSEA